MPAQLETVLNLEVPLIVVIAQRDMPMREVMHLAPGVILEMPKNAHDDLEVLVNNKVIASGRAVKVGEHFGIRVTRVGDVQQRIHAMAGSGPMLVAADRLRQVASASGDGGHSENSTPSRSAAMPA